MSYAGPALRALCPSAMAYGRTRYPKPRNPVPDTQTFRPTARVGDVPHPPPTAPAWRVCPEGMEAGADGRSRACPDGGPDPVTVTYAGNGVHVLAGSEAFEHETDGRGRVVSVRRGGEPEIRVGRDRAGNVVEISQGSRVARFSRDELGRIADAAFADGSSVRHSHDELGNLRLAERGDGSSVGARSPFPGRHSRHTNISSHREWGNVPRWPGAPRPVPIGHGVRTRNGRLRTTWSRAADVVRRLREPRRRAVAEHLDSCAATASRRPSGADRPTHAARARDARRNRVALRDGDVRNRPHV